MGSRGAEPHPAVPPSPHLPPPSPMPCTWEDRGKGDEDERIKHIISCINGHNLGINSPRNSGGSGLQGEGKHLWGRGGWDRVRREGGWQLEVGTDSGGVAEGVQVAVGGGVKWGEVWGGDGVRWGGMGWDGRWRRNGVGWDGRTRRNGDSWR